MNLEDRLRGTDQKVVSKRLPPDSALVEYVWFNEYDFNAVPEKGDNQWLPARYMAFIVSSNDPDRVDMIDLGEADNIDRLIREFRSQLTQGVRLTQSDRRNLRSMNMLRHRSTGVSN